jgi:hypothetical protein
MDYREWLKGLLVAQAEQRLYANIPNDHVSPGIEGGLFEPDTCYLRIWLNGLYMENRRVLYQMRCPLAHAACRFNYASGAQDLRLVVGEGQSDNLAVAVDRAVNLNYPLLGPVPYRGGDVELQIALVAMKKSDYGDQLLDYSCAQSVDRQRRTQVALPFLQPLKRGIEGLFGLEGMRYLGIHDTFTSSAGAPIA